MSFLRWWETREPNFCVVLSSSSTTGLVVSIHALQTGHRAVDVDPANLTRSSLRLLDSWVVLFSHPVSTHVELGKAPLTAEPLAPCRFPKTGRLYP